MGEHDIAPLGERHGIPNWQYADTAERLAATGFIASDVTKWARQLDDNTIWMLTDESPITWVQVGGPQTPSIIDETGAPLTLDASHDSAIVLVDDDVTVPIDLGIGFSVMLLQTGASSVEIIESGTTVNNRQGHAHIAGQFGIATLLSYATDVFLLGGDTDT